MLLNGLSNPLNDAENPLSLEYIDRRYILYIPAPFDFYPYSIEKYEECIKSLRLNLLEK